MVISKNKPKKKITFYLSNGDKLFLDSLSENDVNSTFRKAMKKNYMFPVVLDNGTQIFINPRHIVLIYIKDDL